MTKKIIVHKSIIFLRKAMRKKAQIEVKLLYSHTV